MENNLYIKLIYKSLKEEITSEESIQLKSWLESDNKNQELKQQIEEEWTLSQNYHPNLDINVDGDLQKLKARIQNEVKDTPIIPISKHHERNVWKSVAAAVLVLLVAGYLLMNDSIASIEIQTAQNEKKELILPDGSKVWLNENTKLTYPENFTATSREISLEGEAFFEIMRDTKAPFSIDLSNSTVTVLGTSFNINTQNDLTTVDVKTGEVSFKLKESISAITLIKNESAILNINNKTLIKSKTSSSAFAWQTGVLVFNNHTITETIEILRNHFKVKIVQEAYKIKDCTFTGRFEGKNVEEILDYMAEIYKFELFKPTGRGYIVRGGRCE